MEALSGTTDDLEWIPVEESSAPGHVRGAAMALARRLGFSDHRVGEIAIAATELATNLQLHARQGIMLLRLRREGEEGAVELVAIDRGPGIDDFDERMRDGHSTAGTLGIGLGAIKRLASRFDVHSVLDRGTVMSATFWRADAPVGEPVVAAITRAIAGETVCGDACAKRVDGGVTTLLLADGLGHGELAAHAARESVRIFVTGSDTDPTTILQQIDRALRATRGAAIAVVRIDPARTMLTFAGVGNVATWVDDGERRRELASTPGIVGHNLRRINQVEIPLTPGALVIMHSDGLSSKWTLASYPGLRSKSPLVVAATILRDAGIRHDDAGIVVARS